MFESYRRESKKNFDDLTASYKESKPGFTESEKKHVQYYAEKRQVSFHVEGLEIDNTTFYRTL